MSVALLREVVRSVIVEAVMLSKQQMAAKVALDKVVSVAGAKAGVLFSRILSKRISPEEIEQMAGEVRAMAAKDPKAVRLFDQALEDAQAGVKAQSSIGDMISSTLNAAPASTPTKKPADTLSFKSIARA